MATVDVQKKDGSEITMTFVVPKEDVEKLLPEAAKELGKSLKLDGFRPGHIPQNVVEQKVGRPVLWEEAARMAVPQFYADAVKDNKLEPIGRPEVSLTKVAPDNDLEFTIRVAVLPDFTLPEYTGVEAESREAKVTDEDVDKVLDQLRTMRASYTNVDREAKKGDRVELDLTVSIDGKVIENGKSESLPLTLGEEKFIPGFEDQIMGAKKGDAKTFTLPFPKDYFKKEIAGKDAEFAVKVKQVQEVKKPELTDEFAQTLGGDVKTALELKTQIRKNLTEEAAMKEKERFEMAVFEKVADNVAVELPKVLVDAEIDKMYHELKSQVSQQGMKMEDYISSLKTTEDKLREGWKEQAEKRVRAGLVLRKIGEVEKIQAPKEEIDTAVRQAAQSYPDEAQRQVFESDDYRHYVEEQIKNRKVLEFLAKNAKAKPAKDDK